jgi:hypothetical protein
MKRILLAVLGAVLVTAGCADPSAPTTPTPATPTIKETFSDTLLVLGANTHQFSVDAIGGVKVTLTSVEPGAAVGIGVGTPSLGSCSLIDHVEAVAGKAVLLSGTATVPGAYCVTIYDLGNLVEPAVYTIDVLHS